MTKAALCTTCNQIIGPFSRSEKWNWCGEPCLHTAVRWRDPQKGHLEVTSLHGPNGVLIIGLHNAMITQAIMHSTDHEMWRDLHKFITSDSPGYLFDKSKRDCWAVIISPGESNDTFFMPYQEAWNERTEEIGRE